MNLVDKLLNRLPFFAQNNNSILPTIIEDIQDIAVSREKIIPDIPPVSLGLKMTTLIM